MKLLKWQKLLCPLFQFWIFPSSYIIKSISIYKPYKSISTYKHYKSISTYSFFIVFVNHREIDPVCRIKLGTLVVLGYQGLVGCNSSVFSVHDCKQNGLRCRRLEPKPLNLFCSGSGKAYPFVYRWAHHAAAGHRCFWSSGLTWRHKFWPLH